MRSSAAGRALAELRRGAYMAKMRLRLASCLVLIAALYGCGRPGPPDDFEGRAYGAAYWHFRNSAIRLVVSDKSGRRAACGYARNLAGRPGGEQPFIWVDGRMYAGDGLRALKEAEVIKLCGPNWTAPQMRLSS